MKNIYTKIFLLFSFILQLYHPEELAAQCLCAGGVPATAITQTVTVAPVTTSSLNFNFQQFDPSIGTLSCVTFTNTISGISVTGARNTNIGNDTTGGTPHIDSTNFLFSLSLLSKVTGPAGSGISVSRPFNTLYGYDKLSGRDTLLGLPGDTITYGPTNFITPPTTTVSTGGNSVYLGLGTVNFNYTVNGGMITLDGGANYNSTVATTIGGTLELTYYWCPAALLATSLQNFSAFKMDNNIVLKWDAQNAETIDQFEIEYSTNGKDFISVAKVAGDHAPAGSYKYDYAVNNNSNGYLYFRIKQTSNSNKSAYSAIQKISLNDKTNTGITIHPNPAVTGMTFTFDRPVSGDYSLDLVNMAGQVILNKKVKLINSNLIPFSWTSKPAPGIYFTRVTNTGNMEQQVIRLLIQ